MLRGYGAVNGISDEAELYKQVLGEEHVYVNSNRRESLNRSESKGYDLVLMDDAFQHRQVGRDLDVVVMDVNHSVLNDSVMPIGTLREPICGLNRAHSIVLTRCESLSTEKLSLEKRRLSSKFPHLELIEASTIVEGVKPLESTDKWNKDYKVFLFSGIGDPEKFKASVLACGMGIVGEEIFRDHHFITENEFEIMENKAKEMGAEALLTTTKDAVKIRIQSSLPIFTLNIELEISEETSFFNLVIGK